MEWSDTGCFRSMALRADDFDDSNALVRTRVWPEDKYFKFIDFYLLFCVASLSITMVIHTVAARLLDESDGDPREVRLQKEKRAVRFARRARWMSLSGYLAVLLIMMGVATYQEVKYYEENLDER